VAIDHRLVEVAAGVGGEEQAVASRLGVVVEVVAKRTVEVRWHGDVADAGVGLGWPDCGGLRGERDGSPYFDHVVGQIDVSAA
jgi:hypothetical protein